MKIFLLYIFTEYLTQCLFIVSAILLFSIFYFIKRYKKLKHRYEVLQLQSISKIDAVKDECFAKIESLRKENIDSLNNRANQWLESERETLHVLNNVSNLLDLNEKIDHTEAENILIKLDEIQYGLNSFQSNEINIALNEIQIKLDLLIKNKN